MYYVNIYFSYKDTFHYVLVSDTKVGKCWFREVTWPLALQKTFQEKSTMQSQKNIITKIYDRLESKEVIVRELINGFRIKGHLREGKNG